MSFLQPTIEKKLSRLFGRKVTFAVLKISPLSGKLEAEEMLIAGDAPDEPLLTVRRITAQVSLTKALAGHFDLKSLVIESPKIFITRYTDGAFNLPRRPSRSAPKDHDDSKPLKFEAQSLRIEDGQIRFREDAYTASADQISGDFKYQTGNIDLTLSIPKLGRRDIPAEFGPLNLTGHIALPGSLAEVPRAPLNLALNFPAGLSVKLASQNPSLGRADFAIDGAFDATQWLSALPPGISLPPILTATTFNAPVQLTLQTEITLPLSRWLPSSSP